MLPNATTLWIVKVCAVGVIACVLWLHGNGKGRDAVQAAWDADKAAAAIEYASALRDARDREMEVQAAYDAAAADWEKHRESIESQRDKLAADLRAGRERLQPWWECKAERVPDTADAAPVADGQAELRAASAAAVVSIAAQCDAHVAGLQALIVGER